LGIVVLLARQGKEFDTGNSEDQMKMWKFMTTRSATEWSEKRGETVRALPARWLMTCCSAVTLGIPLVVQYPELRQKLEKVQQSMATRE
jgi:hypothetical protein